MAKVGARSIGILTVFLIIYNINLCATNPQYENDKKTQYESVQNTPSPTIATASAQLNATATGSAATPVVVPYSNRPLLGVNGTGQRKDMTDKTTKIASTTIQPDTIKANNDDGSSSSDAKKNLNQYPKKALGSTLGASATLTKTGATVAAGAAVGGGAVAATVAAGVQKEEETEEEKIIDTIDVPENDTLDALKHNNLTVNQTEDHHHYYNSTIVVDKEKADAYWNEIKNMSPNWMLSQSHRRAMTVVLSFDFPFYGHPVRNVTVATGGFIYTGDYVHSWLAATQYIAPLMANFDTSLSNDSYVRLNDTGSSFTVIWENVNLQDKQDVGKFTFSTTLHKNGDIVFTYFSVPIFVNAIQDDKHPVKVGLSDAYIIDKVVYFARRKTIYEYHRVNFANAEITNSTIITLKALPTCLQYTDCASCVNHVTAFNCTWCPNLNRCSTGTDRKKQDWLARGCDRNFVTEETFCPAIGQKGNNANQNDNTTSTTVVDGNTTNNSNHKDDSLHPFKPYNPTGLETSSTSTETPFEKSNTDFHTGTQMKSMVDESAERKSMGVTLGVFVPICLVSCALLWILYAYRNPHTRSGQLLIQYRPSQWSWRRGEARYTAATIHM
ncbi:Plexin domain-containing protein 2 [Lucilia cuprina]|nr:Plexin domain-containing protein 2 [Lucilia cuprina]